MDYSLLLPADKALRLNISIEEEYDRKYKDTLRKSSNGSHGKEFNNQI